MSDTGTMTFGTKIRIGLFAIVVMSLIPIVTPWVTHVMVDRSAELPGQRTEDNSRQIFIDIWHGPTDAVLVVTIDLGYGPYPPYTVPAFEGMGPRNTYRFVGWTFPGAHVIVRGAVSQSRNALKIGHSGCVITADRAGLIGVSSHEGIFRGCEAMVP